MLLLLAHLALADSFLTSVDLPLPAGVTVPASAGPCGPEATKLATSNDAFEHAMVLGACHGYDPNPALVAQVRKSSGPLHNLDLGWTLMYEATYGGKESKAGETAIRAAMKEHPSDARVLLVAALVLAQNELFVKGGSWDAATPRTREIVKIVHTAAALGRSNPGFQQALNNAVDYLVMYGVFAELAGEHVELTPNPGE